MRCEWETASRGGRSTVAAGAANAEEVFRKVRTQRYRFAVGMMRICFPGAVSASTVSPGWKPRERQSDQELSFAFPRADY